MKRFFFAFTLLIIGVLTSCKKEDTPSPTADFNFNFIGDNNHAPCTIKFNNTSTNSSSYSWDFGNGSSGNSENVTHRYTQEGTYIVKLTSSSGGKSSTITKTITILPEYTFFTINKIIIKSSSEVLPFDGKFFITDVNDNTLWTSPELRINPSSLPGQYIADIPYSINNFNSIYKVILYNWTSGRDSQQSVFSPTLYNDGISESDSYPDKIDLLDGLSLEVQWQ